MKQTINLGAYGWLHAHWLNSFYPEDLPEDWRLGYYSNEFNTVMIPAYYWQDMHLGECEDCLDDVHPEFQFFIECHEQMFDRISLADLTESLKILKPQLSALVFLDGQHMSDTAKDQFSRVIDEVGVDVYGSEFCPNAKKIWRPECCSIDETLEMSQKPRFAFIEDDLTDLRASRARVEPFAKYLNDTEVDINEATMIVNHPQLQVSDLAKFRLVLEIMGH